MRQLGHSHMVPGLASLLVLLCAVSWQPAHLVEAKNKETFPVHRPLVDLREVAIQTVGRDGPRYPDEGFQTHVRTCSAPYESDDSTQPLSEDCNRGYTILTLANNPTMQYLIPLLLRSLQRIERPPRKLGGKPGDLTRHTTVVGVTAEAVKSCERLQATFDHTCASDGASGLLNGDQRFPSFKALAFGFAKLRYILNALTTNTDILYVDADVVFLRDPFPALLASGADIAVASAPAACGSQPAAWQQQPEEDEKGQEGGSVREEEGSGDYSGEREEGEGEGAEEGAQGEERRSKRRRRHLPEETGEGEGAAGGGGLSYSTGITFYRSGPGVLRCVYSLLLDMAHLAHQQQGREGEEGQGEEGAAGEEQQQQQPRRRRHRRRQLVAEQGGEAAATPPASAAAADGSAGGPVVREQGRFAAFMPMCAGSLGLTLRVLPAEEFVTACGSGGDGGVNLSATEVESLRSGAVAV
ncbi:hypothetical protein Agub_g9229, partial [Astrephomene gubernaculifera]